jgi:site-specific DNA-methyltransferase (adenine-specific)
LNVAQSTIRKILNCGFKIDYKNDWIEKFYNRLISTISGGKYTTLDSFLNIIIVDKNDLWIMNEFKKNVSEFIQQYEKVSKLESKLFGEVFTPRQLIEEMLDTLPKEVWQNKDLKWLDPAVGIGNFPSVILDRLMTGLVDVIPNEEERRKHILEEMLYMVDISTKNLFLLYMLFDKNREYKLNVYRGSFLTEDFDKHMKEVWKLNGFDVVIGNPPYQSPGDSRESQSIYHNFILKSLNISNLVLMITPSKWFTNPSMREFREYIIKNGGIKIIKNFDNSKNIFSNVDIKGGVSYCLYEKGYKGNVLFNNKMRDFTISNLITNTDINNIYTKFSKIDNVSIYMNSDQYFGITNSDSRLVNLQGDECYKCYTSSQNGNVKFIDKNKITIKDNISKYKVFLTTASGSKESIGDLGRFFIGYPNEVSTRSFIHFHFETKSQCESFISYLSTNFVKKMIRLKKQTQLVSKACFEFVPVLPFDRTWSDQLVYEFLKLTDDEIKTIECL